MGDLGGTAIWVALVAVGPLLLLAATCFVKFSVVLALVRNAIGAPQVPPNLVVTALALLLSIVVMAPVAEEAWERALAAEAAAPAVTGKGALAELQHDAAPLAAAAEPLRRFLARHAHADDRATFVRLTTELRGAPPADDGLLVLAPAFVTSELTEAFVIGVLLLLPFLLVDLLVGLVLAITGLSAAPSTSVALPLKLLLFVAVDGWRVLAEGLIVGYT